MKKIIYSTFILLIHISCTSLRYNLHSDNSGNKAFVENEDLNVLYRGIKNHLRIYVPKSDSIKVSGSGIYKEEENKFYIIPSTGKTLQIKIISYCKGKETVDRREFRILNIGKLFASINNRTGKITLSKDELAGSVIEYYIPQFVGKLGKVGKFSYKINNGNPMINYGSTFSKYAKDRIYTMQSGDSMVIDHLNFHPEMEIVDLKKASELVVYIE